MTHMVRVLHQLVDQCQRRIHKARGQRRKRHNAVHFGELWLIANILPSALRTSRSAQIHGSMHYLTLSFIDCNTRDGM